MSINGLGWEEAWRSALSRGVNKNRGREGAGKARQGKARVAWPGMQISGGG